MIAVGGHFQFCFRGHLEQFHDGFVDDQRITVAVFYQVFDHNQVSVYLYTHSIYEMVGKVNACLHEKNLGHTDRGCKDGKKGDRLSAAAESKLSASDLLEAAASPFFDFGADGGVGVLPASYRPGTGQ